MQLLFTVTLFIGAVLLFLIQPMFARMALPLLGGTPAVWNTCVVFFQAALLAGYAYAHLAPAYLGVRRQAFVHLGLLALPLLAVPIAIPNGWQQPNYLYPSLWLLGLLFVAVGLPFFVVATTAPLLQRWFASTGHPSASDPYFLYAASNLGSMLALLSYPVVVEPLLPLRVQSLLWTALYGLLVLLMFACAVVLWTAPRKLTISRPEKSPNCPPPITWGRRLRWVVLAALPCSLMLSVTTYLTTDVAPMPLLWVVPLAVYLLTFILAFGRRPLLSPYLASRAAALVVLLLTLVLLSEATEPAWLLLPMHLLGLFVIALFCHTELAQDRPDPRHLTEFYLWLSAGGVLGGLCNALLAPLIFSSLLEYPLTLTLAALFRAFGHPPARGASQPHSWDRLDVLLPVGLGLFLVVLVLSVQAYGLPPGQASVAVMFALPALVCYTFIDRPLRFGFGIAVLFLASGLYQGVHGRVEYSRRSYFGVHRVTIDPDRHYRRLVHGNTIHGMQSLDPARRREPLTYYHKDGPAGHLFKQLQGALELHKVGVVGLGVGSLAAYGQKGQHWTFYEIDPAVVDIAHNLGYFTFTRDCPAEVRFEIGDARLKLAEGESPGHDLLFVDAFNSDSLPIHLLTREALQVYLRRLNERGVLAFHVSNRYLDLEPLLAELARDAGLVCLAGRDTEDDPASGKYASRWVVMGRPSSPLADLTQRGNWARLEGGAGQPLWTDDFSNLLQLVKMSPL